MQVVLAGDGLVARGCGEAVGGVTGGYRAKFVCLCVCVCVCVFVGGGGRELAVLRGIPVRRASFEPLLAV
jgi:hypothetical protein